MPFNATPGDAATNSYASLAEAEAYMLTLVHKDDWTAGTDPTKEAALQQATRLLDTLTWKGRKATAEQALAWPRTGVVDREGYEVSATTIPAALRNACAEFAFRLLGEDRAADAGGLAPASLQVGSLNVSNLRRRVFPASVLELVADLREAGGCIQMVRG